MTEVRRINPEDGFLREFTEYRSRVKSLETKPSGNIVIRETLTTTDPATGVKTTIGKLPDGSYGFQPFIGDTTPPPVATQAVVRSAPGSFTVAWDGLFVNNGAMPRDFEHVNVIGHKMNGTTTLLSLTVGVIRLSTESVIVTPDVAAVGETWQFSLEAEDYNKNKAARGARSASVVMSSLSTDQGVTDALAKVQADANAATLKADNAQTSANSAQTAANSAASVANSKGKTIIQSVAPDVADQLAQNLWIDTTGGANTPKRWSGSAWVAVTDKAATDAAAAAVAAQTKADQAFNNAATAATAAGTAQTTADGKNQAWYQDTAPAGTSHKIGDTWFDTANSYRLSTWTGTIWQSTQDAALALNTANTKGITYTQSVTPPVSARLPQNLWIDTSGGVGASVTKFWDSTANSGAGAWVVVKDVAISVAQQAAIDSAATTAQAKADAAQSTAISTASSDATAKANNAQAAAINAQAFSANASFDTWSGTFPSGFVSWNSAPVKETAIFRRGPNAMRWNVPDATTQQGAQFDTSLLVNAPNYEFYTVEVDIYLVSGTLDGSGMILDWTYGGSYFRNQINFVSEIVAPVTGKWYTVSRVLRRPSNATGTWTSMAGYLMAQWSGHGTGAAKNIIFDWLNIRPSTNEEILSYTAPTVSYVDTAKASAISTASSDATTKADNAQSAAIADSATKLANKNKTYFQTAMPAGGTYLTGDVWISINEGNKVYVYNGSAFIVAQDTAIDTAIYSTFSKEIDTNASNKWLFTEYDKANAANTTPSYRDIAGVAGTSSLATDAAQPVQNVADNYFGQLRSIVYVSSTKSVAITATHDDGGRIYVDGVSVYAAPVYTANVAISFSLTAGWHVLDFMWAEQVGGDGWTISPTISSQVTSMFAPVSLSATASTASTALTSANGKNKVVYSTSPATGTSYAAGDTWFQRDGTGAIIAQWEFTTSWQTRTLADSVIGNLSAGKITSGTISSSVIGANSIDVSKLVVSDFNNFFDNGRFNLGSDGLSGWISGQAGSVVADATAPSGKALSIAGVTGGYPSQYQIRDIPFSAGEQVRVKGLVKSTTGTSVPSVRTQFLDASKNMLTNDGVSPAVPAANTWGTLSGKTTAPANTVFLRLWVEYVGATGSTGYVTELQAFRMNGGELIVDGALDAITITGPTIQTESTASRGIKLTGTELAGYDTSGVKNFSLTTGGTLAIKGAISSGSTISGATITGAGVETTSTASRGVKLSSTGITTYDGSGNMTFKIDATTGLVEAPGIKANSIKGDRLEGGTVSADKLIVGDFENHVIDPYMSGIGAIGGATYFASTATSVSANAPYATLAKLNSRDSLESPSRYKTLRAGETIYAEAWVRADNTAISTLLLGVWVTCDDLSSIAWITSNSTATLTSYATAAQGQAGWVKLSGTFVIPSTVPNGNPAIKYLPWIQINGSTAPEIAGWYLTGWASRRQSDVTTIANGAITTAKIVSGGIDAGAITAATITATQMKGKSITVDKLVVTSTDNLVVEADFGNSGSSWQLGANNTINATAGRGSLPAMRFTGLASQVTSLNLVNRVSVGAEDRFRASMWVKSTVALTADKVQLRLRCYTTATAYTDITAATNLPLVANTWTNVAGISPVLPSGTIATEYYLAVTNDATGTITDIDYVGVTRAADGNLVVDGAIDGKTITGATVRTAATGARIVLDQTSLNAWNTAGDNYFNMTDATGVTVMSAGYAGYDSLRKNYCTNPSFESDISGWTSAQTIVRDTAQFYVGTASLKATYTSTADRVVSRNQTSSATVYSYGHTFSVYVRHDAATSKNMNASFYYVDASNVPVSGGTNVGSTVSVAPNTWTRLTVLTPTWVNSSNMRMEVVGTSFASTENMWVDAALLEDVATVGTYFDGSTAAALPIYYIWNGNPNLVTSEQRQQRSIKIKTGGNNVFTGPGGLTQSPGVGFIAPTAYQQTAGLYSDGQVVQLIEGSNDSSQNGYITLGNQTISLYSWLPTTITSRSGINLNPQMGSVVVAGAVDATSYKVNGVAMSSGETQVYTSAGTTIPNGVVTKATSWTLRSDASTSTSILSVSGGDFTVATTGVYNIQVEYALTSPVTGRSFAEIGQDGDTYAGARSGISTNEDQTSVTASGVMLSAGKKIWVNGYVTSSGTLGVGVTIRVTRVAAPVPTTGWGSGDIIQSGNVTVQGKLSATHRRTEYYNSFDIPAGASWDSGTAIMDTSTLKTTDTAMCSPGPYSGSIVFNETGYYQISLFIVPRGNPGLGWTRLNHSNGENLGQTGNGSQMWETYNSIIPVYFAAGQYVRSQMSYATAHTIDCRWKIVKVSV